MKVYSSTFKNGYQGIIIKNEDAGSCIDELISDYSIIEKWPHIQLSIVKKGKKSDFPYLWNQPNMLVISEKAKNTLGDFFDNKSIELLPMYLDNDCYYLVHVIHVEKTRNDFKENDDGDVQEIFDKEYLEKNNILDKGIFRVYFDDNKAEIDVFITEKFIKMIENTDLKGAKYELIWDSEVDYSDFKY